MVNYFILIFFIYLNYFIYLFPTTYTYTHKQIGHIAHFNLKDQHLPYKKIIGQVILDKFRTIKTVVNKTQNIDNTFRFFQMELLAGENNFNVTVKESNCIFNFDFSRVYFNSRLQYEHNRLVESFPESDVICDVMAGVGPFAVPLAKNGCFVYANDLNPHAFECLVNNSAKNHVSNKLKAFNLDGRVFLKDLAKSIFVSHQPGFISASNNNNNTNNNKKANNNNNHHHNKNKNSKATAEKFPTVLPAFTQVVMNLPAIAIEFLDAFRGIFNFDNETEIEGIPITVTSKQVFTKMPTIHVYMFSRAEDLVQDGKEKACHYLGYPIDKSTIKVHDVRDVAPNKHMLCVSFPLPAEVAFGTYPTTDSTTTFATSTDTTSSSSTDDSVSLAQKRTREETEAEHSTNDQEGNSNDTVKRVRSDDDN